MFGGISEKRPTRYPQNLSAEIGRHPQMALTDTAIRSAKLQAKPYKLTDGKGLYLLVSPSGGCFGA